MTIQEASNKVREFMEMTDNPVSTEKMIIDDNCHSLCSNLLAEEYYELQNALARNNFEEALDGAADSLFVILFTLHKLGIADKLDAMMEEVCRSNMTKLWTVDEVNEAEFDPKFGDIHQLFHVITGNDRQYVVKRISDGKVIKSPSYSPADAKRILMESSPT